MRSLSQNGVFEFRPFNFYNQRFECSLLNKMMIYFGDFLALPAKRKILRNSMPRQFLSALLTVQIQQLHIAPQKYKVKQEVFKQSNKTQQNLFRIQISHCRCGCLSTWTITRIGIDRFRRYLKSRSILRLARVTFDKNITNC